MRLVPSCYRRIEGNVNDRFLTIVRTSVRGIRRGAFAIPRKRPPAAGEASKDHLPMKPKSQADEPLISSDRLQPVPHVSDDAGLRGSAQGFALS